MDCIQIDRTRRVRLFPLDVCDRIQVTGNAGVVDLDNFETITFTDNITPGGRETITTTSGATCRDKVACPTDLGTTVGFTECTQSWTLLALAGYGNLELSTLATHPNLPVGTVIGFNRCKVSCDAAFALEVLYDIDGACDEVGSPQCIAQFFPKLARAVLTGDKTVNGVNVMRGTFSATSEINTAVFDNYPLVGTDHPPTGELAYWAPWIKDIEGDADSSGVTGCYSYTRLVDCPVLTSPQSCELRAVVVDVGP